MIPESKGWKALKELVEILKASGKTEFSRGEIQLEVAKHIGFSNLTQERYFYALRTFGFIKPLDNGKFVFT